MQPIDLKGRQIFPNCYIKLVRIGKILEGMGWRESKKTPNLFYKEFADLMVFADMRGTEIVPIWEDSCPMIYVHQGEQWMRRRSNKLAQNELDQAKIPYRYSYYDECEEGGLIFGDINWDYKYPTVFANGFCNLPSCNKMLDGPDFFCSEECERAYDELKQRELRIEYAKEINSLPRCQICKIKLRVDGAAREVVESSCGRILVRPTDAPDILEVECATLTEHHVCYDPEEIILVCPSCHQKIHHSNEPQFEIYRPKGMTRDEFIKSKSQNK